ncbi:MAG: hypothetical protein EOO15_14890 [Chitinophagaceae bacterium]|nr:MAG: hypothetical protein EOO15_14890 [Chitinophagaceae bacterium]
MSGNFSKSPADAPILFLLALINGAVLEAGMVQDSRWYSLLYITVPIFVWMLLRYLLRNNGRKRRRRYKELLERFSGQAARQGLRFSSEERLQNGMLGLDARKGKLFVCQRYGTYGFQSRVFSLQDIESCSVRTEGVLRLHLRRKRPFDLAFYRPFDSSGNAASPLAPRWARLLQQLLRREPVETSI